MYHSDGAVFDLIPDLLDMGVSLLNPIQPDAKGMEPELLKDSFGEQLAFHGGVDIARLLPSGEPAQVQAKVRHLVQTLGEGGGYILAGSHHIQANTPVENILAMYDVGLRYREQ